MQKLALAVVICLMLVATPTFATTKYWNSTSTTPAGQKASNATNWDAGILPTTDDDIIFNTSSTKSCNWDLGGTYGWFNITTGYGATQLNFTTNINASTGFNQWIGTIQGGGTISTNGDYFANATMPASGLNVIMAGTGKTININPSYNPIWNLTFLGDNNVSSGSNNILYFVNLVVAPNVNVSINSGKQLGHKIYFLANSASRGINNSGTIQAIGTGTFGVLFSGGVMTRTEWFGNITAPVQITTTSTITGNETIQLGENTNLGNTLSLSSQDASEYLFFNSQNYQLTTTGQLSLGERTTMTQGTGVWNFNNGFVQSGNLSVLTQGSNISVIGTTTIQNGTRTGDGTNWWIQTGNITRTGGVLTANSLNLLANCTNNYFGNMNNTYKSVIIQGTCGTNSNITTNALNITSGSLNITDGYFVINSTINYLGGLINIINGSMSNATANGTNFDINATNISLSPQITAPADKAGLFNLSAYLNITNITSTGEYGLNMTYLTANLNGRTEANVQLYSNNGTWYKTTSSIDTANHRTYSYKQSYFGVISPMAEGFVFWQTNQSQWPAKYQATNATQMNISIYSNESISKVVLESNYSGSAINYTITNATFGGVIYNLSDISPAGTFYWRIFTNDSFNTANQSDQWFYTINRADNTIAISLSPDDNLTYPNTSTASCIADFGTPAMARDDVSQANPDAIELGAGIYNYSCIQAQTQNYSANSTWRNITINKANNPVFLYLNNTENNYAFTYPQGTLIYAVATQGSINIYRNGTSTGFNPENILLGVDTWEIKANATGNANYSDNDTGLTRYAIGSQGSPTGLRTYINGLASDTATSYPYTLTIQAQSTTTITPPDFYLYLNQTYAIGNPATIVMAEGIGTYNVIYNTSGNTNWSSASNSTLNLTIYDMHDAKMLGRNIEINPVLDVGLNGTYWSIGKYYNITDLGNGIYDLNITYVHADLSGNPFPETNLRLYNWSGSEWQNKIGHVDTTNHQVWDTGLTLFGEIAPMSSASLVPANAPYVCTSISKKIDICSNGEQIFVFNR